jgi:DnaK suppressor protein
MLREGIHAESDPRWRAILEARWRDRLEELTELSLAYHGAAADASGHAADKHARRLLRNAIAARQRLADTEEALGRLAAGSFGRCERCRAPIPLLLLAAAPETRYCADCAAAAATGSAATGSAATGTRHPGTDHAKQAGAYRRSMAGRR